MNKHWQDANVRAFLDMSSWLLESRKSSQHVKNGFPWKILKVSYTCRSIQQENIFQCQLLVRPLSVYSMGDESSNEIKLSPTRKKKQTFEFYFIFPPTWWEDSNFFPQIGSFSVQKQPKSSKCLRQYLTPGILFLFFFLYTPGFIVKPCIKLFRETILHRFYTGGYYSSSWDNLKPAIGCRFICILVGHTGKVRNLWWRTISTKGRRRALRSHILAGGLTSKSSCIFNPLCCRWYLRSQGLSHNVRTVWVRWTRSLQLQSIITATRPWGRHTMRTVIAGTNSSSVYRACISCWSNCPRSGNNIISSKCNELGILNETCSPNSTQQSLFKSWRSPNT